MREIKFRVKDFLGKIKIISLKQLNTLDPEYAYDKFMGQFTGLHDKNGKEIYEGDILSIISFYPPGFDVEQERYTWAVDLDELDTFEILHQKYGRLDLEIIGNIYETPELLEDK